MPAVEEILPAPATSSNDSTQTSKPCAADSNATCTSGSSQTASSDIKPSTKLKDNAKLGWRVTQTLVRRVTEAYDTNPAKLALNLAKMMVDIKQNVEDNIDATDRRIISIGLQLQEVSSALNGLSASSAAAAADLERVLKEELEKLMALSQQSTLLKVVDYEHQKTQIAEIFEQVNQARITFALHANLRLLRVPDALNVVMRQQSLALASQLCPSAQAHHLYFFEGEEAENLRRMPCIPGTRVSILDDLVKWATDPSSEIVYWLSGPAGSGKSTIAYTITCRFELALDVDPTVLGGTFFCSRLYENTRLATCIIRMIVYQFALKYKPFASALFNIDISDLIINEDPRTQLKVLLIEPWLACQSACTNSSAKQYLFVLDALDEIVGDDGEAFLKCLLEVFTVEHITGLKFLVTGCPNPKLETQIEQHDDKRICRLHDVTREEVQADIHWYYEACLKYRDPTGDVIQRLVEQADGLFIYAATVIRSVEGFTQLEQAQFLTHLVNGSSLDDTTTHLHGFYLQILRHSFNKITGYVKKHRIDILRVIFSTFESVSPAAVCGLLGRKTSVQEIEIVIDVVKRLHSVLYFKGGSISWYHKSFQDFIFTANPEGWFWHHPAEQHDLLVELCFATMERGLSFNMAGLGNPFDDIIVIPSDSSLTSVDLCPALQYACQFWSTHLGFVRHLDNPGITHQQREIFSHFIISHSLYWIECMQLLNMARECPLMLHRILGFLDENSKLAVLCARAIDFAFSYNCHLRLQSCQNPYAALIAYPCHEEPQLTWLARVRLMNNHQHSTSSGSPDVWGIKLNEMFVDDNLERYVSTQAKLTLIDMHLIRCNNVHDINIQRDSFVVPVSCLVYSMDRPLHAIQQTSHVALARENILKVVSKGSWLIGHPVG